MSTSLARAPWQVVLAASSLLVVGVTYVVSSLLEIARFGDRLALESYLSDFQAVSGFEAGSVSEVHEWMSLAALVFGVVAAVFIILAILLWQGAARPGVRVVATITILIALIGSFAPLLAGSDGTNVVAEEAIRVQVFIHFFAFIATALLWMPSMRTWIKEH
jgi:hypothetical protein